MSKLSTNLLIIDDLPDNRKLLRMDLEDEISDINVDEAESGADGLALMKSNNYTIVICDILMPQMDGFEVLQHARKLPNAEGTPFLFLSALRQPETIRKGLELGAVDFLTKPYDVDELVYKVRNLAGIKHLQEELKSSQLQLLAANGHLKKLNEEKNRVMQIVSHDLRSPLAGVKGLAKILFTHSEENDRATVHDLAKTIYDTADSLTRLVNDLLNITRIESSTATNLEIGEVDLAELVARSIRTFSKIADHKNIRLEADCAPGVTMQGDEPKLAQVLNNLISNAIKFTESNGIVRIEAAPQPNSDNILRLTVNDDGIGIPAKYKPILFKKFGEHQRHGTDGERGVGLGLPIVKCFVDLHAGQIDFSSEEGRGTRVTITLPREIPG